MASRKKKGNKKLTDWDDEEQEKKIAQLNLASASEEESDSDASPPVKEGKGMAFNMLAVLGSEEDSEKEVASESSDIEEKNKVEKESKKTKQKAGVIEKIIKETVGTKSKELMKGKGKKGKKGTKEDEDLEALLADLEKPVEKTTGKSKKKGSAKVEPRVEESPAFVEELNAEIKSDQVEEAPVRNDAIEGEPPQKKKDKKKKKKNIATEKEEDETKESSIPLELGPVEEPGTPAGVDEAKEETEMSAADKKKKKKKEKEKEKKAKEGEKKDTKKKKHVDLIKQMLRQRQEEEERILRQQKEEEERLAALQKAKEEEARLAREKKEAEKQRKKERDERLKAEGKYLTPAQREKLRRQQAMLKNENFLLPTALRQDEGDSVPAKRPVYGKKRTKKGGQIQDAKTNNESTNKVPGMAVTDVVVESKVPDEKAINEVAASWEDEAEVKVIVDSWEDHVEELVEKPAKDSITNVSEKVSVEQKKEPDDGKATLRIDAKEEEELESSSEESSEEESSPEEEGEDESSEESRETKEQLNELVRVRLKKRREAAEAKRTTDDLRAPVICVLGHVDTGKTKMLDTIRRTNVQDSEAGGITQQIGATQVPALAIKERTKMVRDFNSEEIRVPGFLIIDTPGHESFSNLRSRGSSLCDYAILIVDIMHGLEPQTIESLKLLLKRGTPFVIALNKIDRLIDYDSNPRKDVYQHLKSQPINTQLHFKELKDSIIVQFAEQGINVALSNENKDPSEYVSMVPTSAYMGDGIGNLMAHIVNESQTRLSSQLAFCEELDCTVMEVKALPGLGTTIDVILVNGTLKVGDVIILTGTDGAIVTQIRELLMPQPLKELRVKNAYEHYQSIKGAQGVKVLAKRLEKALAGLPLFVANKEDEVDVLKEDCDAQLSQALMGIKKKPEGVYVQASTLGSLEALLCFLKAQKIPYSNVNIGPVHKKDVQKAAAMLEHKEEYSCILAFDVPVSKEVEQFAASEGVRIFSADIIYHLEENFLNYREQLRLKRRRENEHLAIFPCKLRILPQCIFNARNPIVIGVAVEAGQLKRGTPICVPSKDCIFLGTVASIERNHEQVDIARTGDEVCIKIENTTGEAPKLYGRHFNYEDMLVSRISRETIDVCKAHFRDDLSRADWQLVVQLKKLLDIL